MFKIIYFNRTTRGDVTIFERELNMPYDRVRAVAVGSVYQYANFFSIEPVKRFRYCMRLVGGALNGELLVTVAGSIEEAERKLKAPCKIVSIEPLRHVY